MQALRAQQVMCCASHAVHGMEPMLLRAMGWAGLWDECASVGSARASRPVPCVLAPLQWHEELQRRIEAAAGGAVSPPVEPQQVQPQAPEQGMCACTPMGAVRMLPLSESGCAAYLLRLDAEASTACAAAPGSMTRHTGLQPWQEVEASTAGATGQGKRAQRVWLVRESDHSRCCRSGKASTASLALAGGRRRACMVM